MERCKRFAHGPASKPVIFGSPWSAGTNDDPTHPSAQHAALYRLLLQAPLVPVMFGNDPRPGGLCCAAVCVVLVG